MDTEKESPIEDIIWGQTMMPEFSTYIMMPPYKMTIWDYIRYPFWLIKWWFLDLFRKEEPQDEDENV